MKNSHRHGVGRGHRKYSRKSTLEKARKVAARVRRAPKIEALREALAKGNE